MLSTKNKHAAVLFLGYAKGAGVHRSASSKKSARFRAMNLMSITVTMKGTIDMKRVRPKTQLIANDYMRLMDEMQSNALTQEDKEGYQQPAE